MKRHESLRDDPLGIHAEVEQERLKSRFRDRASGERIHPIDHDFACLVDFVINRRRRQAPTVFDAARRVLRHVDTQAIRFLVLSVLEDGECDIYMQRRCARVVGYCELIEAALDLK